jgi:hemolysin D
MHGGTRRANPPPDGTNSDSRSAHTATFSGLARRYTARIARQEKGLVIDGKPLELAPGMAVVAEIKTGKRRVLDYLLSPLHRYGHDVQRER